MNLSLGGLDKLCRTNVVELKFKRRMPVKGKPLERRMFATRNFALLESPEGKEILNYTPPTQSPAYNAASRGLLTVWDIFMQDWRNIPATSVEVISTITADKFWEYFTNVLSKMTASQKAAFMDK